MLDRNRRGYVLAILTLVVTLNYLDRDLIVLLLQPIKEDLKLSDTQLGFLNGIAFGLFYATLGLPIARWSDRGNRVTITSVAIGLWGMTVVSCVFVSNFVQLLFARVAAGVGEAGCMPPTYSLLGDYFPAPAERTRAMAVYMLASPIAALIGFTAGGWLNDAYGWRAAFLVMGIPGLLTAVLVRVTIAEPRILLSRSRTVQEPPMPIKEVLKTLMRRRSCRQMVIGVIVLYTMGLGLGPWFSAFMMRSHGMATGELGLWFGAMFGVSGIIGIASGGYVIARWFAGEEQTQARISAVMIASLLPFHVLFLLLPGKHQALLALMPFAVVFNFVLGPTFALLQRLVVDEMRAITLAVVMFLANLIGIGLGPQLVGVLSDLLAPILGRESLRYSMLTMSFVALWSAYHFWQCGRSVKQDLAALERSERCGDTGSAIGAGVPHPIENRA